MDGSLRDEVILFRQEIDELRRVVRDRFRKLLIVNVLSMFACGGLVLAAVELGRNIR